MVLFKVAAIEFDIVTFSPSMALSSLPYNEQIFVVDDEISTTKFIPRETLRRVATPQRMYPQDFSVVGHDHER